MRNSKILVVMVVALLMAGTAKAANLSWDPNSSNGAALGGSCTWNTGSAFWWNDANDVVWDATQRRELCAWDYIVSRFFQT